MQIRFSLITTCLATVISTSAFANSEDRSCYKALTNNNTADSQSFQIAEHKLSNQDDIGIAFATSAVLQLAEILECPSGELIIEREGVCREIVFNNPISEVCFVETNLGYFFTQVDLLGNMNLVFNRKD